MVILTDKKLHVVSLMGLVGLLLMCGPAWATGIVTDNPDLPPDGVYISPAQFHEYSALGIILDDPLHRPLVDTAVRTNVGPDEYEQFDSIFEATEIGLGLGPLHMQGPVSIIARYKADTVTGTFDTEIVSMSLTGNTSSGPIMVRQDVGRPSVGQTTITDLGGGLYHIDSFFDVFTELSVDGGQVWMPSDYATRMTLAVPEPGCATWLIVAGVLACLARGRRW